MRVVVTGATGYIGSRLALQLHAAGDEVVPAGRRDAPELAAAGLSLRRVDLRDRAGMRSLVEGADVVVHSAAWLGSRGEAGMGHAINVEAAAMVASLCAEARVGRLLHLSSIAACGAPGERERIPSDTPPDTAQDYPYGRTKALGEAAVRAEASRAGLPLVVVRPGMVHGPGSDPWTRALQGHVKRGLPTLFGDGLGLAPLVYIDNLIDVLDACVRHDDAPGATFHVCDAPVTWRALMEAHGKRARRAPRAVPVWAARALVRVAETTGLPLPITRHRLGFVTGRADYRDGAVERVLGVRQRVSFDEAMAASWRWLDGG